MTVENGRRVGVGNSFGTWAVRVQTASRVANIGTRSLLAIRQEMLSVITRIDDELKRRNNGRY